MKIERDAQELADSLGVKIFQADIIYHLFDKFTAYRDELKQRKRDENKHIAVFPCKLKILPQVSNANMREYAAFISRGWKGAINKRILCRRDVGAMVWALFFFSFSFFLTQACLYFSMYSTRGTRSWSAWWSRLESSRKERRSASRARTWVDFIFFFSLSLKLYRELQCAPLRIVRIIKLWISSDKPDKLRVARTLITLPLFDKNFLLFLAKYSLLIVCFYFSCFKLFFLKKCNVISILINCIFWNLKNHRIF